MVTYKLPGGTKLVLAYHTPGEWAEVVRSQLLKVGCSEEYAEKRAARIRKAKV